MPKKTAAISMRIPDTLRARLDRIHARHLTNDTTVGIRCLEAFCDYVEKAGKVEFPVQMTSQTESNPARRAG